MADSSVASVNRAGGRVVFATDSGAFVYTGK